MAGLNGLTTSEKLEKMGKNGDAVNATRPYFGDTVEQAEGAVAALATSPPNAKKKSGRDSIERGAYGGFSSEEIHLSLALLSLPRVSHLVLLSRRLLELDPARFFPGDVRRGERLHHVRRRRRLRRAPPPPPSPSRSRRPPRSPPRETPRMCGHLLRGLARLQHALARAAARLEPAWRSRGRPRLWRRRPPRHFSANINRLSERNPSPFCFVSPVFPKPQASSPAAETRARRGARDSARARAHPRRRHLIVGWWMCAPRRGSPRTASPARRTSPRQSCECRACRPNASPCTHVHARVRAPDHGRGDARDLPGDAPPAIRVPARPRTPRAR